MLEYCNNGANLAQWPGQLTISVIYVITYFNQYHEALFFFPNGYCCGLTSCMNVNIFQVCRKCGLLGYYNHKLKTSYCSMCKNGENMAKMRLPYACKLLFQVLPYCTALLELWCNVCNRPLMNGCPHVCLLIFARSRKR